MSGQKALVYKDTKSPVQEMAVTAVFIALTFVFTAAINVKLPFGQGGLIHMGNIPLFLGAILYGKKTGMLSGAIGMGLFDLLSGWVAWAPFTFLIVGCMGFVVGLVTEKQKSFGRCTAAIVLALAIKVVGYYVAEVILYHNFLTPAASIFGNVMQVCMAGIIVLLILPVVKKVSSK